MSDELAVLGVGLDTSGLEAGAQRAQGATANVEAAFNKLVAEADKLQRQLQQTMNVDSTGVYRAATAYQQLADKTKVSRDFIKEFGFEATSASDKLDKLAATEQKIAALSLDVQLKKDQEAMAAFRAETEKATAASQKRADTASNQLAKNDAALALKEQQIASDAAADSALLLGSALLVVGATVIGAVKGLHDLAEEGAAAALQAKNLADETGFTIQQLTLVKSVSEQNGIGVDRFRMAMEMFEKNVADEGSRAFKIIQAAGVDMKKAADDPYHAFVQYGEVLAELPKKVDAVAASKDTIGRNGAVVVNVFRDLIESGGNLEARLKSLGVVMETDTVGGAAKAAKASIELTQTWDALKVEVADVASPAMVTATKQWEQSILDLKPAIKSVSSTLADMYSYFAIGSHYIIDFFHNLNGPSMGSIMTAQQKASQDTMQSLFEGMAGGATATDPRIAELQKQLEAALARNKKTGTGGSGSSVRGAELTGQKAVLDEQLKLIKAELDDETKLNKAYYDSRLETTAQYYQQR